MKKYRPHAACTPLEGLNLTGRPQEIIGMTPPLKTILIQCPFRDNISPAIASIDGISL